MSSIEVIESYFPDEDERLFVAPEIGDKVSVHYIARLEDGAEFDNSVKRGQPLDFVVGAQHVMPGLEKTVCDMKRYEHRTVRIPACEAYGDYDPELTEKVPLSAFPDAERLNPGIFIVLDLPGGPVRAKVRSVEDGQVVLDYNHELAGKSIILEAELLSVAEKAKSSL